MDSTFKPLSALLLNKHIKLESTLSLLASSLKTTLNITMKAVFAICAAMVAGAQVRLSGLRFCMFHVRACGVICHDEERCSSLEAFINDTAVVLSLTYFGSQFCR